MKPYGQPKIYLRGETWWIHIPLNGKRIRCSTGTTDEAEARAFLATRLEQIGFGSRDSEIGRFLSKVTRTETCWIWSAGLCGEGYGKIQFRGRQSKANRVSFVLFKGEITPGMVIRHTCDVKACVNPDHLIEGTQKQNVQDAIDRGRFRGHYRPPFVPASITPNYAQGIPAPPVGVLA